MMNHKTWIAGAVLGIVLANTGCVSCCSKSYAKAWTNGAECELPSDCRSNVYVFMVDGVTPTINCGLGTLREKLAECGFAKIGLGDIASIPCIAFEIKRLSRCEPDARFVLVGYDFGGAAAVCLSRELSAKGIPIEAVVLLDPLGCSGSSGTHALLITSGKATSSALFSSRVVVPEANHFNLPTHPATVNAICDLLKEIAIRNYQPGELLLPEWQYPHAPAMRPIPVEQGGPWDFLADNGSTPPPIGTRIVTQLGAATPNAPARPSTSAGAVIIPK
jgi:hypothetical protein